ENHYHEHYIEIIPTIAYERSKTGRSSAIEQEARDALAVVRQIGIDAKSESETIKAESQTALAAAQAAAAQTGISTHATNFENEATDHANASGRWMYGAIA